MAILNVALALDSGDEEILSAARSSRVEQLRRNFTPQYTFTPVHITVPTHIYLVSWPTRNPFWSDFLGRRICLYGIIIKKRQHQV